MVTALAGIPWARMPGAFPDALRPLRLRPEKALIRSWITLPFMRRNQARASQFYGLHIQYRVAQCQNQIGRRFRPRSRGVKSKVNIAAKVIS